MSTIAAIRDRAVTLIEAETPDVRTGVAYSEVPAHEPLDELPSTMSAVDTTRGFHVEIEPLSRVEWQGQCFVAVQSLVVRMRYDLRAYADHESRTDLLAMAMTDQAAIVRALTGPSLGGTWTGASTLLGIEFASATALRATRDDDLLMHETRFSVRHEVS